MDHPKKPSLWLTSLLLLSSFLSLNKGAILPQVGVETVPSTVQQSQVTITLYTQLVTQIPVNGGLNVTLPSEVSFSTTTLNCTLIIPSNVNTTCTQTAVNRFTARFSGIVPAGPFQIQLTNGINNPVSVTPTSSFIFATYSAAGLTLDSLSQGIQLVATTGNFVSTTLTTDNQVVGDTTSLNVQFVASHMIPLNGQIQITMPSWNPQSPTTQLAYLPGAISCTSTNTAVLQAFLQCSYFNSVLTVTNLASKNVPGGVTVSFKVSGFRNPLSTALVTGFSLVTADSQGGLIDITGPNGASLKISQPALISAAAFTVDSSTDPTVAGYVGERNVMQVSFASPVPLNQGCTIIINLPSQFNLGSINTVTISGLLGIQRVINFNVSGQTLQFQSCTSYTQNSLQGIIQINSLTLPGYAKTTSSLNVQINDASGNPIAVTQNGPTFTPIPGTGLQVNFTASPNIILSQAQLTISIYPQRAIGLVGQFLLQFPPQYSLQAGACSSFSSLSSQEVNPEASCAFTSNLLNLTNFVQQTVPKSSDAVLTFQVGQVTLPQFIAGQTFVGWIKQQDPTDLQFYNVELFTGVLNPTMSFGNISAVITPGTLVAYQNTNYTLSITPDHPVGTNGYIVIKFPPQITIPNPSFSQSQCQGFTGFPTTPTCTINIRNSTVTINNGFRVALGKTNQIGAYTFNVNIPGIVNPLTLQTTDSFQMWTYTFDGYLMDYRNIELKITMQQVPFISSLVVTPGSLVNSAVTNYTFLITPIVPVNNSQAVVIQFPSEITVPSSPTCVSTDTTLIQFINCTVQGSLLQAVLTLQKSILGINPSQTFRMTIKGIKNPVSTKQTSPFGMNITDSQGNTLQTLNSQAAPITVTTNTPNTISNVQFTPNTTGAAQFASYNIVIYPNHTIDSGGGLLIVYPAQIGVQANITASVSSSSASLNPQVSVDQSARRVIIANAFSSDQAPGPVSITLAGFINPLYNTIKVNSFIVMTMNIDSQGNFYFIDQVTNGLILNSPCDYPCASCSPNQPSVCLSCYQTSILNKLQGQTCVSTCANGKFYNVTNYSCDNCSSICLTCTGNADQCTQCGIGNLLYFYNNTCLSSCPSGYVEDASQNLCLQCTDNCRTCKNTTSTCTSCYQDLLYPYFYDATCYQTCPANVTVPVDNFQCLDCDSSCKTCSIKTNNCTSCLSYMRFDPVLGTCTSVCQQGIQIYDQPSSQCLYCDLNCATCAGNTTTCTSCNRTGEVLTTDNTCRGNCTMDNQVPIAGVCTTCQLPCARCKESVSHCTACQENYYLYNMTCVQYCPLKFVADNSTMQCVYQGLVCPEDFHVNEAGDGCIPNEFQCPEGYMINHEKTACVPAPGSIVPFPFLFLAACFGVVVLGSYIKDKFFTKVLTCLIALIGMEEILIYGIMVCYAAVMEKWLAFVLAAGGLGMLIVTNISFYLAYKREVAKDPTFSKWCRLYPKTERYISLLSLILNFKTIKLLYSGFYGQESCIAHFEDPIKNFLRPLRFATYFSFLFVYGPILAADVILFMTVEWGYQLLILAIESALLAVLITILTIIELRNPEKLLLSGDEQYIRIKPKSFNLGNVMGVDVDESTLIRSRVIDDEYEIKLRKKALVQILGQVGKNFLEAQTQGMHLGQDLDKCMSKFDEDKLKLRRAFSLEEIKEEDSWVASGLTVSSDEEESEEFIDLDNRQRRHSFPLSPRSRKNVPDPQFKAQIQEIKQANLEFLMQDNVYADCKPSDKTKEERKKKTVSRRTQTYLRELLMMEGEELGDSDMEVVLDDDAEIESTMAKGLIDGVIDGLSDMESQSGIQKKKTKKKKKNIKRGGLEVPDFELADIMGEFEIDDLGNFIILRGENGELLDKKERRVNRRGYLIDRFGNIINKETQIIFKAIELDSDDEIPAPFGFEKRKKNLLSIGENGADFRVQETEKQVPDDEDVIEKELKALRQSGKRRKTLEDGQIVEEDEGDSSVDSLMAESPTKYAQAEQTTDVPQIIEPTKTVEQQKSEENEVINKVTKAKVPVKKALLPQLKSAITPKPAAPQREPRPKSSSLQGPPPRRIKREDTKEIFPKLAVETIEQKRLFKIAESIGGMANQLVEEHQSKMGQSTTTLQQRRATSQVDPEYLERLKQEHLKDIMNETSMSRHIAMPPRPQSMMKNTLQSEAKLPQAKSNMLEKIYGNLGDVVNYEERLIEQKLKGPRELSPSSSQVTLKRNLKKRDKFEGRKLTGLEAIYLQKFDKAAQGSRKLPDRQESRPRLRYTVLQYCDDPEILLGDDQAYLEEQEKPRMIADTIDRLQRQYMGGGQQNRMSSIPITSMGFTQIAPATLTGGQNRQTGSATGFNTYYSGTGGLDVPQLDPVKMGNWMQRTAGSNNLRDDQSVE